MARFRTAVLAAAVLVLEGAALVVIAVLELFALGEGGASSTASGLALIALTLVGAAGLIAFAVGTLRHASWARSGGIVLQVLQIALALAALSSIRPVPWLFVLVLGLAGAVGLVALIATVRREGAADPRLHRREDGTDESSGD
ncbi:hypothetical protein [Microbacterium sp.]|uniref:hypothetical protein n=1 Tax=Microbacterium sp. TaxID=51671 RepID=UPI003C7289C1